MMNPRTPLRFRFGAMVEGEDGALGTLRSVLVDPDDRRICGLVVGMGFLLARELRVSWNTLVSATEARIQLSLTLAEARDLQEKQGKQRRLHSAVEVGVEGEPAGKAACGDPVVLGDSQQVLVPGGAVAGSLRQLVAEGDAGEIVEFVIESGLFSRRSRRLPIAWVRRLTDAALEVEASLGAVAGLPGFRGDRELRGDILDAWFYDDGLRMTLLQAPLDVSVCEGIARIEGYVSSRGCRRRLEARARSVPGVREVIDAVVTDDELGPAVQAALVTDPRTRDLRPQVQSSLGLIVLDGDAPDQRACEAASEVATSVLGVRGVINRLRVEGNGDPPALLRFLGRQMGERGSARAGLTRTGCVRTGLHGKHAVDAARDLRGFEGDLPCFARFVKWL